jgi:predicted neuraminidase
MTWKWKVALENEEKNNGSFSYPCLIQTTDGLLHITYSYHKAEGKKSIKYVSLDPDKITK